jgi:hypothetical protein
MERDSQIGIQWAWESKVMYARDRYARNRDKRAPGEICQ